MSEAIAGLCIRFVALLETEEADTGHGFSSPRTTCDQFNSYAHDVGENNVEVVHFAHLHGFTDTATTHEIGRASITSDMIGRFRGVLINMYFVNYGVGCVIGTGTAPRLGATVVTKVFTTPTAPLKWALRVSIAVHVAQVAALPGGWAFRSIRCSSRSRRTHSPIGTRAARSVRQPAI
ncbi:hypothetical protein [Burkholderia sp. MSMB1826]|uniref:hypothetical protein n=1 Tax=Burkholderia sp. MSMB1826 TaxID=1637875 RepID=UPI00211D43F2|nr:hypothetical protein [Burkholderia sp. MSMB1826]